MDELLENLMTIGKKNISVGFFPGSFDPIHYGHVYFIEESIKECDLDIVIVFLNNLNYIKKNLSDISLRAKKIIDEKIKNVFVITSEEIQNYCGYTDDDRQEIAFEKVINYIKKIIQKEVDIVVLRGSDNFIGISNGGYVYPKGLCKYKHAIGIRDERGEKNDYSMLEQKVFIVTPKISSTEIRKMLTLS